MDFRDLRISKVVIKSGDKGNVCNLLTFCNQLLSPLDRLGEGHPIGAITPQRLGTDWMIMWPCEAGYTLNDLDPPPTPAPLLVGYAKDSLLFRANQAPHIELCITNITQPFTMCSRLSFPDWSHPVESRGLASLCFRNEEKRSNWEWLLYLCLKLSQQHSIFHRLFIFLFLVTEFLKKITHFNNEKSA